MHASVSALRLVRAVERRHFVPMPNYDLPPRDPQTGRIHVIIDTPRLSRAKYKYDEDKGIFMVSKLLPLGHYFPYNFGYIPGTMGGDGDPLDVLVLSDEPFAIGSVATVRLIGVLKGRQTEDGETVDNDRLLGVFEGRYNPAEVSDISGLHDQQLKEIEHFFVSYNQLAGRTFTPAGRGGAAAADAMVDAQ